MKTDSRKPAAVLWSGGKNSYIALYRALENNLDVRCLITLHREDDPAHPLSDIFTQSSKLGLPLQLIPLSEGENLEEALQVIIAHYKLEVLVAGDVQAGGKFSSILEDAAILLELELWRPLWDSNRFQLLSEVIEREILARITWLGHTSLPQEWLGREIDVRLIADLARFTEVDLSGENGEYHTLVECSSLNF